MKPISREPIVLRHERHRFNSQFQFSKTPLPEKRVAEIVANQLKSRGHATKETPQGDDQR